MLSYDMGYDKRKMATIPNEIDDESLLPNEAEDIIIQQIEDETSIEEPDNETLSDDLDATNQ